jgi:hypothetical protein
MKLLREYRYSFTPRRLLGVEARVARLSAKCPQVLSLLALPVQRYTC